MTVTFIKNGKTRIISGLRFTVSAVASNKKDAEDRAEYWRGKGVRVRVVKESGGYSLFTR